jgi:uncharacterized RDD family membrane protein YckC
MSEDAASANTAYQIRAGFWGRCVALGIDLLLISVLIAVIGLASTGLTGGKVRVANTVVDFFDCTGSEAPPPDLPVLEGFEGTDARRCTRSVLGIAHDWTLVVREKMTAGEDKRNRRQVSMPLDAKGHPVRAFYLDDLIPLVLAGYLLLLEWRLGTTLGKRIVGIRVHSLGGGPMDLVQAGKRVLMRLMVRRAQCAGVGLLGQLHRHDLTPHSALSRSVGPHGSGLVRLIRAVLSRRRCEPSDYCETEQ